MACTTKEVLYWTNRIIPYQFAPDFKDGPAMLSAMASWEKAAGVCFTERGNEPRYVVVSSTLDRSNSSLGMQAGPAQVNIKIDNGYVSLHELGHLLGLIHEQSRPDRNDFIELQPKNIDPGWQGSFGIDPDGKVLTPYDRYSVMHYPAPACGWGGTPEKELVWTMRWKADWNAPLGAGPLVDWTVMSDGDREAMRTLYNKVPGWGNRGSGPNCTMTQAPRCITFQNEVWAVWQGGGAPGIFFSHTADGMYWYPQDSISNAATACTPAIAEHNGVLYIAWHGYGADEGIYYSSNDGTGWKGQQKVPGVGTSEAPALYSFQGLLWLVWTGSRHDGVWYTAFDASTRTWAPQQRIDNLNSQAGPVLAVQDNVLHLAVRGLGDDRKIYILANNGGAWGPAVEVPRALTTKAPALVSYQGALRLAWKDKDDRLCWAKYSGAQEGWSGVSHMPDFQSTDSPSLTVFQDQVVACWAYAGLSFARYPQAR